MAIYGIGLDLIRVDRLRTASVRWGERFQKRVFTESELAVCAQRKNWAACLAMRFAAKEAFVKALGIGMRGPITWVDVEILGNALGKPEISLSPKALDYCKKQGIHSWQLSLTDDGEYGAAIVILEC